MRLNPALEEARRHRELDGLAVEPVEVHAGEPARIDVVADFRLEAFLHP